jgi:hypothetical protein
VPFDLLRFLGDLDLVRVRVRRRLGERERVFLVFVFLMADRDLERERFFFLLLLEESDCRDGERVRLASGEDAGVRLLRKGDLLGLRV